MANENDIFNDVFQSEGTESAEAVAEVDDKPEITVSYEDFDFEDLCAYAGIDCIATSGLLSKIFPIMVEQKPIKEVDLDGKVTNALAPAILESFHRIEIPAQIFILDLEINGIGYSVERNRFMNARMLEEIASLDDQIFTAIGKKIDLNSGPAVAKFLYEERGFTIPFMTKGGEPATDGSAILTLAGLDPLGGKYVTKDPDLQFLAYMAKRRDISAVRNTFVATYVEDFVKRDGRIHSSYFQAGTSSFRISGSNPNGTQLPRPKHGYNVRSCYTTRPGYVFVTLDFSSAEVKVLANISREEKMLDAIRRGLDFHSFSASAMRGIPYEEMKAVLEDSSHRLYKEYKGLRQLAKVLE
jgi:DNA polymerase I